MTGKTRPEQKHQKEEQEASASVMRLLKGSI